MPRVERSWCRRRTNRSLSDPGLDPHRKAIDARIQAIDLSSILDDSRPSWDPFVNNKGGDSVFFVRVVRRILPVRFWRQRVPLPLGL